MKAVLEQKRLTRVCLRVSCSYGLIFPSTITLAHANLLKPCLLLTSFVSQGLCHLVS